MAQTVAGDWVYLNTGSRRQNNTAHRVADLPQNAPGIGAPYKMECGRVAGYGVTTARQSTGLRVCARCEKRA